jgi:hypothetical protein
VPLIRFGNDERPLAWWEWLFFPIVLPLVMLLLSIAALLSIPYFALYPDRHATSYDFGTEEQQEVMRRYRRFTSRVPLWRRCCRVLTSPFRRRRSR